MVVSRLLDAGVGLEHLILADRRVALLETIGVDRDRVSVMPEDQLYSLVGFEMHRGVVGLFRRPVGVKLDPNASLMALLEGINDHANLGSMIRAGVGLGVDGFLLDPTTADPYSRRAVRVSMGAVGLASIIRLSDLSEARDLMAGMTVIGLDPQVGVELGELVVSGPVAVMLGAEGPGLTDQALSLARYKCSISMARGLDSLNVAQAAAIAFHHFRPGGDGGQPRTS